MRESGVQIRVRLPADTLAIIDRLAAERWCDRAAVLVTWGKEQLAKEQADKPKLTATEIKAQIAEAKRLKKEQAQRDWDAAREAHERGERIVIGQP